MIKSIVTFSGYIDMQLVCKKLQNLCSHSRWRNKSRNMSMKKVILSTCAFCWCFKDIIYETIHGMESFKFTRSLSFIRPAHCSDFTAFHKLWHFSVPCPSTPGITLLLCTSFGNSAFWYTHFYSAPHITTNMYLFTSLYYSTLLSLQHGFPTNLMFQDQLVDI